MELAGNGIGCHRSYSLPWIRRNREFRLPGNRFPGIRERLGMWETPLQNSVLVG